jgi:hypothetical protein
MNKYLTSLVAVAAVTTMGASIPAQAETNLEHVISVITDAISNLPSITENTTTDDIKALYNDQIADTNLDTKVTISQTTAAGAEITVDIIGTTEAAATIVGTTPAEASITTTEAVTLSTLPFYTMFTTTTASVFLEDKVNDALNGFSLNNNSRGYDLYEFLKDVLYSTNVYATVHNFTLTPTVGITTGSAVGIIQLNNNDDGSIIDKIPFNLPVYEAADNNNNSPEDKKYAALDDAYSKIYDAIDKLSVSNDTTVEDLQKCADSAIANTNIKAVVTGGTYFNTNFMEPAIDAKMGQIYYTIALTDTTSNLNETNTEEKDIDTTATAKLRASVKSYLAGLTASENMKEDDILAGVTKAVNDSTVKVDISDFYLRKAISSEDGYCDFGVELEDSNQNYIWINYSSDGFTSTAGTGTASGTNTTSGSSTSNNSSSSSVATKSSTSTSSSSSSSSHHSTSSASSSSSSSSTTSTASSTSTSTTGTSDSTIPVSLANMSKEAVKAVEAKVVSNIGAITGAVAGQAKEVVATDGTKVSVTTITKDGKSVGAVITAETPSEKAVIPVDKDAAPVAAVYKYVPLLDKYIQVQDAVITADAITLPVQANATYVASPVVMSTTATISQGWVQAGSNWYMVNATGDPLTGWQKDSTGWTYMSPTNGVMQTGWKQDGGTWYYLKNNGYMSTGWVKDGAKWYYCNADGSMAANTAIDGYQLDASGAWIE